MGSPRQVGGGRERIGRVAPATPATVVRMHELSICRSIADVVERHADGRPVTRVRIQVGHFRQIVPATLEFCWEMTVAEGPLAGSILEVDHVPARLRCRSCDTVTELTVPVLRCERCGGVDTELVSGEELFVTSLDLRDEPDHVDRAPPPTATTTTTATGTTATGGDSAV